MFPHIRDTLYDLIRYLHDDPVSSRILRNRYRFYHLYYAYWILLGVRLLIGSLVVRFNLSSYLQYDLTLGIFCRVTSFNPNFLFIFSLLVLFPIVVHFPVYYHLDNLIWEYMYDVQVGNVDQLKQNNGNLLIRWSWRDLTKHPIPLLTENWQKLQQRYSGKNVKFTRKLVYHPQAPGKLRSQLPLLGGLFEALSRLFYLVMMGDILDRHRDIFQLFATNYLIFTINVFDTISNYFFNLIFYQATIYNLNIISQESLVCHAEYRHMNVYLHHATSICTKKGEPSNSRAREAILHLNLRKFRSQHTRMTLFLLRANAKILEPNILIFIVTALSTSSYIILLLYFSKDDSLSRNILYSILVWEIVAVAIIIAVCLPVNKSILSSKPHIFTVIKSLNAITLSKSTNLREKWKLVAYYELLHREEKELALSAGMFGTLNSKKFFELFTAYIAVFLNFASAFQNELSK